MKHLSVEQVKKYSERLNYIYANSENPVQAIKSDELKETYLSLKRDNYNMLPICILHLNKF